MEAERLFERAAALGEGTAGLVISVALVTATGVGHSTTSGEVAVDPGLAGSFTAPWDDLTVEPGPTPTVRSARRGESPAVALTPTTLATDLGVLEVRGDELVAGGAYPFTRT